MILSATAVVAAASMGLVGTAGAATPGAVQPSYLGTCSGAHNIAAHTFVAYCAGSAPTKFRAWGECKLPTMPSPYTLLGTMRTAGGHVSSSVDCGGAQIVDWGIDTFNT